MPAKDGSMGSLGVAHSEPRCSLKPWANTGESKKEKKMRILVPALAAALTTGVMAFATTASALPLTNAAALNNVPSMHMEAARFASTARASLSGTTSMICSPC
jgi:hypothetical protein